MRTSPSAASAAPPDCDLLPLPRTALPADTVALARFLIGATLVRETEHDRMAGRIVETEAYLPGDAASHAFRGPTPRNASMFLERGHAYVYIAYGVWPALNVSSEQPGIGAGVLLRALEPIMGLEAMRRNRGSDKLVDSARGPGRLATALAVTPELNGVDLCAPGALFLADALQPVAEIGTSVRIGITKEADRQLRFFERGSPYVSGSRKLNGESGS